MSYLIYLSSSSIFFSLQSLDRLILSLLLTAYMFIAWSPDRTDYDYQRQQFELKKLELNYDLKQEWMSVCSSFITHSSLD